MFDLKLVLFKLVVLLTHNLQWEKNKTKQNNMLGIGAAAQRFLSMYVLHLHGMQTCAKHSCKQSIHTYAYIHTFMCVLILETQVHIYFQKRYVFISLNNFLLQNFISAYGVGESGDSSSVSHHQVRKYLMMKYRSIFYQNADFY